MTTTTTVPTYEWREENDIDEDGRQVAEYTTNIETESGGRLHAEVGVTRRGWTVRIVHDDDTPDAFENGRGSYEDALFEADELLGVEYRKRVQAELSARITELTGSTVSLTFRVPDGPNEGRVITLDRCVPRDGLPGWSGVEGKRRYSHVFEHFVADDDVIQIVEV